MPTALENVFYNNTTIKTGIGCTIEYNMNSMIDGIQATTTSTDANYISGVSTTAGAELKINPFKKLFPVDSVIKPFRPNYPGVKYYIMLPNDTPDKSFSAFRTLAYPGEGKNAHAQNAQPRVYYPGISTNYKYWVTPKDTAANITITYKQTSNPVTGNKNALSNKIVVRFEKNHSLPQQYKLIITPATGSPIDTGMINTPATGEIVHYYNGTNWSTTSLSEPITYSNPQEIKSVQLITGSPASGRVIGVIEISARWIKDISDDIASFDIDKETSSSVDDILPVGYITANSLILKLNKYNTSELKISEYNRSSSSLDNSILYMYKNAEVRPYIKVYHSGATTVSGQYDKVFQGVYYADSWSITEYGDASLTAIDASKYLMETMAPDIICEEYQVTAIIRRLLDSVGFTSYNFNLTQNDKSVPSLTYWWTEDTSTVWEHLQILCRDIQMNAVFDDAGILQFYSRDYMYSKTDFNWEFLNSTNGSKLANIISLDKREVASANQVKVLWQTYLTSNYVGNSSQLWSAPTTFLAGGGLKYGISSSDTVETLNNLSNNGLQIDVNQVDDYSRYQSIFNFSGYLLIESEIIEFDALQYQYVDKDDNSPTPTWISVWVTSDSDVSKYRYLAKPGYQDPMKPETAYFKPTGRIRVKQRGALGTDANVAHTVPGPDAMSNWTGRVVRWQA